MENIEIYILGFIALLLCALIYQHSKIIGFLSSVELYEEAAYQIQR